MPTRSSLLAEIPLFSNLTPEELAKLSERVVELREPEGKLLFHAGDPGDTLYFVLEGEVDLFLLNRTGDRIVTEIVGPGQYFGESSLLAGSPRGASAKVSKALHALVVDRESLAQFLTTYPTAALDLMLAMGQRLRDTTRTLRDATSRNVNVETADERSAVQKAADWISDFSGSLPFLFLHMALFTVWIGLNVGPLANTALGGWDAYPFGLLTMSVSLEAIFLSVFVLLSQNRQAARDRVRNDVEYEINVKAELQIGHLHDKVDRLYEQVVGRLADLERNSRVSEKVPSRDAGSAY
ncbi:MAG TPA: DUF1003 domain-containing protein [Polyangiales bacterium]|nr:DUF1003 domain-containing protein [Polyangiales bacterium]